MDKKGADNVATHTIIIMLLLNVLIVIVGTTNGVTVYSAGWRVATLPLIGISTAVVSVTRL